MEVARWDCSLWTLVPGPAVDPALFSGLAIAGLSFLSAREVWPEAFSGQGRTS